MNICEGHDRIEGRKILIERIELVFIINGQECSPLTIEQPNEINLAGEKINIWASFSMQLDPNAIKELLQITSS